ncbi:MAG: hypothetical protein ACRDJN_30740, partial [Chloroflexota bacterium]
SVAGWRHAPGQATAGAATASAAVIGGRRVTVDQIDGVLTRLPSVFPDELTHIVPADRTYVAAEMRAFLIAWLSTLPCPVLNRPSPGCLAGPAWSPEQWVRAATRLGIPARPFHRHAVPGGIPSAGHAPGDASGASDGDIRPPEVVTVTTVTIVGRRCLGTTERRLAAAARRLARAAGADLLSAHFDGPGSAARFLSADPWPDVSAPAVADAVARYFRRGRRQ